MTEKFFEYLIGAKGSNALSQRFWRFMHKRSDDMNAEFLKSYRFDYAKFQVPGAGEVYLSEDPHSQCGGQVGFSFHVSWDKDGGMYGGVLGRSEAKRMAEYILAKCNGISESEEDEIARMRAERLRPIKPQL